MILRFRSLSLYPATIGVIFNNRRRPEIPEDGGFARHYERTWRTFGELVGSD
jgi:hypothetical protein